MVFNAENNTKDDCWVMILNESNYGLYIDELCRIEQASFKEAWSKDAYIKDICDNEKAIYLALVQGGSLIAYANYWLIDGVGNINNVAVDSRRRGWGFGTELMRQLIYSCRKQGGKAMTLEVRESNSRAIALYEKLGFESRGVRPGYYADNKEDAVIMWLNLED